MPEHRILLAEDGLVNQIFTQEILQQMGVHVRIVSNGFEALNAHEQGNFNLILMDCRMPVMDGFIATHLIRTTSSTYERANIPIIALTANALDGDEAKCLECGMNDYLVKPFSATQLREKINYWLTPHDSNLPILDINSITENKNILGSRYPEMLDNFSHDVSSAIHEMEQAIENGKIVDILRPIHTIKSTSRLMGALKLAAIAQELEHAANNLPPNDPAFLLRHRLWHLTGTFKRTLNALSNLSQTPILSPTNNQQNTNIYPN